MISFPINQTGTVFYQVNNDGWVPKMINTIDCPTCLISKINKAENKFVGRCNNCKHIHNFLYPTPIQALIAQTRAKILNLLGGTGSGKTTISSLIVSDHMRNVPNFKVMAVAQTADQLEQTGVSELNKFFFDDDFVIKNSSEWVLRNGSRITWYTSNSEQKIRGANVGLAWLIEASGIDVSIFTQLQTRTRQDEAKVILKDDNGEPVFEYDEESGKWNAAILEEFTMTIVETNPTFEWPRDKALLKSHSIFYTKSVRGINNIANLVDPQKDPESGKVVDMVSFMFAATDNPLMTEEFISNIRSTYKTKEEYDRDIYCDMSFATGMIFGHVMDKLFIDAPEFRVNGTDVLFVESMDPGGSAEGNDETGYVIGTVTMPKNKGEKPHVIIWDGYKKSGLVTREEATLINQKRKQYKWNLNKNFKSVVDPGGVKNDKKTGSNLIKDLRTYDIFLNKQDVNNDVNWGIKRMLEFAKEGKLSIVRGTEFANQLLNEMKTYVWTNKMAKSKMQDAVVQKPVDRNNHLIDAIRFLITVIPNETILNGGTSPSNYNHDDSVYIDAIDSNNFYGEIDKNDGSKESGNISGGGIYLEY